MKKFIKALLLSLLIAATTVTAGCAEGGNGTVTAINTSSAAENTESPSDDTKPEETSAGDETRSEAPPKEEGLWANAKYTEDAEVGEGAVTLKVKVIADNKEIILTVHTDKDNLGAALLEYDLVSGDESEYGLYIKSVNGIAADYDKDGAWWAISKDGEMLMTGADSTAIADGENYEFTHTKG